MHRQRSGTDAWIPMLGQRTGTNIWIMMMLGQRADAAGAAAGCHPGHSALNLSSRPRQYVLLPPPREEQLGPSAQRERERELLAGS
eukprot:2357830-Rhodomonas_salina.1